MRTGGKKKAGFTSPGAHSNTDLRLLLILAPSLQTSSENLIEKKKIRTGDVARLAEYVPSKHKALVSIPGPV